MTIVQFLEEQAKSYKYAIRHISDPSLGNYREMVPVGASANDTIEFMRILQELGFVIQFHRGWVRVLAPHNGAHGNGWGCDYGLTLQGCEVFRTANAP